MSHSFGLRKRIDKVVTVDARDFDVYKSYAGKSFKNLFAKLRLMPRAWRVNVGCTPRTRFWHR